MAKHPAVGIGISQPTLDPLKKMKRTHAIARGPASFGTLHRNLGSRKPNGVAIVAHYRNENDGLLQRECSLQRTRLTADQVPIIL